MNHIEHTKHITHNTTYTDHSGYTIWSVWRFITLTITLNTQLHNWVYYLTVSPLPLSYYRHYFTITFIIPPHCHHYLTISPITVITTPNHKTDPTKCITWTHNNTDYDEERIGWLWRSSMIITLSCSSYFMCYRESTIANDNRVYVWMCECVVIFSVRYTSLSWGIHVKLFWDVWS